ncbi:NAD(P)/FAD-dependent oxidoreductase [Pseudomonas chlororaphis]|uniref:NAD(P)/FAD-dependent oxidoreductase n=1 Tax=Pseudomonas chlororaphis TaxID=587753 RepID=UPI0004714FEE|nr:tryptophan 7-halogenase [Pseudomonas chlororaphis]
MSEKYEVDVLIVGGSMAGSCLARHLRLRHPDLNITVVEKKSVFDHGIGESMLEIFWDYACKDLGLSKYLESNYFYKHGLRFFFEQEGRDCSLPNMSEMGRTWYHAIPAHQINRKKFDNDLIELNRNLGIRVDMGVSITDVERLENGKHKATASDGTSYLCRWLVDASGFSSVLGRKRKDVKRIDSHPVSSAWMRVKNINDIDNLGDLKWRERVNYANRSLSTNHFMYRGYWIWMIPIDEITYSLGVVWHHDKTDVNIRGERELEAFLLSHKWVRELFGDSYEIADFSAMKNMTRVAETFFSPERWFRTGMAAGFIDPLFSSGSAFLTDINRMIVDIIESDMRGESTAVMTKCGAYDIYAHWWLDNFLYHIVGNYHGNYELHKLLFKSLLMDYFGIIFPASTAELWRQFGELDEASLASLKGHLYHLGTRDGEGGSAFAHKVKDELAMFLEETGDPLKNNKGMFHDVEIAPTYMANSLMRGRALTEDAIVRMRSAIEIEALNDAVEIVADHLGISLTEDDKRRIREAFETGDAKSLKDGVELLKAQTKFDHQTAESFGK